MIVAQDPPEATAALDASVIASVRDLRVHFRSKAGIVQAVDGVDLDIHDGETVGLVGETGCGKSVTARAILGLVPIPPAFPPEGSILFRPRTICSACAGSGCGACHGSGRLGRECGTCRGSGCDRCFASGLETVDLITIADNRLREIRGNRIAMIFQDPGKALNPALSVRQQLVEVFYIHRTEEVLERAGLSGDGMNEAGTTLRRYASLRTRGLEKLTVALPPLRAKRNAIRAAVDSMVEDALAETQIPNPRNVMDRYPHELSGGMKQRLMIAQALACNPDLLIADEPTTALDVTVQARIVELINELQSRHRTAVLYISHDLSLVRRVCDRIAVMYAGRIAEIGASDQIFHDPQHPYTQGLLAAIPTAGKQRGHLNAIEGTVPELIDPEPGCRFASRCPHAMEICRTKDPTLERLADDRRVACFLHTTAADRMPSSSAEGDR